MTSLKTRIYNLIYRVDRLLFPPVSPVILCYHSIASDGWKYSTSLSHFTRQIRSLLSHGYSPVRLSDIGRFLQRGIALPRKCFAVTFDDGYSNILAATKFLTRYHISPTLFVVAGRLSTPYPLLSFSQIKKLHSRGWEIGCHSHTHADLSRLSYTQFKTEISGAKEILQRRLRLKINYFAYPRGRYSKASVLAVSKAGFTLAFSVDNGFINSRSPHFLLPRIGIEADTQHHFLPFLSPTSIRLRRVIQHLPIYH